MFAYHLFTHEMSITFEKIVTPNDCIQKVKDTKVLYSLLIMLITMRYIVYHSVILMLNVTS